MTPRFRVVVGGDVDSEDGSGFGSVAARPAVSVGRVVGVVEVVGSVVIVVIGVEELYPKAASDV